MSQPTHPIDVEHVAGYSVDAARLLSAFGISPGDGVVSVSLNIESDKLVELTVRRYIKQAELDTLMAELEASRPQLNDVKSVRRTYG